MRTKNEGRWKWLLVKNRVATDTPPEWLGLKRSYNPMYRIVKTGGKTSDVYEMWEIVGEYDDPKEARAMLALAQASNS